MTKLTRRLLFIVLFLVLLIAGMVLSIILQNNPSPDIPMTEPEQTVLSVQELSVTEAAETASETIPETTLAETQSTVVPTPGEKRISKIVMFLNGEKYTEEMFFYDHSGNIVSSSISGYENGRQTYSTGKSYQYSISGALIKEKDLTSSIVDKIYHYDYDLLTGYTYREIMANEIAYSVTYHYERDENSNVVKITTTSDESDISTIGEYAYDNMGRCISAREQEQYGDYDITRSITYDHSYTSAVISTTVESTFGSESTIRRIQFGNLEYGYIFGPRLYEGYSIVTDTNGCITAVKDPNGQTVASLEYITLPPASLPESSASTDDTSRDPVPPETIAFRDLPSEFVFTSGAGAWRTRLTIEEDGSFTGDYHDSDMGLKGENYPRGTVSICSFEGKFTAPEKVTDYIYSMKLEYLTVMEPVGKVYYEDDIRYIVTEPVGMTNPDIFYIYLPGTDIADLPENFFFMTDITPMIRDTLPSGYYGIFNEGGEAGFTATLDNYIWHRDYTHHYQHKKVTLRPKYYSNSTLMFFPESGASEMRLEFVWSRDGQTEFRACDYDGGTGGYDVSVHLAEDLSRATVSVTSIHGIDLSPWGGTADGTFTAEFISE